MAEMRFLGQTPIRAILGPLARLLRKQRERDMEAARRHPDYAVLMEIAERTPRELEGYEAVALETLAGAEKGS